MINESFYTNEELELLGFKSLGNNVKISKFARFYNQSKISIGDNVRIDDFCILVGNIDIASHIHISAFCALYGTYGIKLKDFSGLSPRTTIFSATDDFKGDFLIGPIHKKEYTNVISGEVVLEKYSQVGTNSTIFPSVTINEGAVVGAMSFVNKSIPEWTIFAGIPARFIKTRNRGLLKLIK